MDERNCGCFAYDDIQSPRTATQITRAPTAPSRSTQFHSFRNTGFVRWPCRTEFSLAAVWSLVLAWNETRTALPYPLRLQRRDRYIIKNQHLPSHPHAPTQPGGRIEKDLIHTGEAWDSVWRGWAGTCGDLITASCQPASSNKELKAFQGIDKASRQTNHGSQLAGSTVS